MSPAIRRTGRQLRIPREPPPATLVPTHGDWQPRNWLVDNGTVRVIDFGRAGGQHGGVGTPGRRRILWAARTSNDRRDRRRNCVVSEPSTLASSRHVQRTPARSAHP
ncbi:phosphotransferase family protein [Kribbella sp. NPDC055110]